MLEIKNLTKVYRTKGIDDVKALNDVSISFNSTGLVFLLGKSGSGKSTLLNVIGGLDTFDSGDIIIKGRSAKDFKQKDFDSYRNTYVGFVFQEYNVLPEFTVEKNIALALELQGKKADKKSVDELLEQVDLVGYAKRKPNQLSGGQKQRIAIARALIKEPEIIMADEPTGALDSTTGKQVFETLKKLSENKLIIVVSHDREFAMTYGDRIIELKDGKVISDVTKRKTPPKEMSDGFRILGNNMICIEKHHKMTDQELNIIRRAAEESGSDMFISVNKDVNPELKKTARIDDLGNSEYFSNTDEKDHEPQERHNNFKLIKSKLKFKDSFKMGASGLKTKKVRLFFTILLSAIALTLFGFADTMASFNVRQCNYDSLKNLNYKNLKIVKNHVIDYGDDNYSYSVEKLSEKDYNYLKNNFSEYDFTKILAVPDNTYDFSQNCVDRITNYNFYKSVPTGILSLNNKTLSAMGGSMLSGRLPEKADEIAITDYQLEIFNTYGFYNRDDNTSIGAGKVTSTNILNQEIMGNKIVGVIVSGFNTNEYSNIKNLNPNSSFDLNTYNMLSAFNNALESGLANCLILHEDTLKLFDNIIASKSDYYYKSSIGNEYGNSTQYSCGGDNLLSGAVFFDPTKTSLKENEVLIGSSAFRDSSFETPFYARENYDGQINFENKAYNRKDFEKAVQAKYKSLNESSFDFSLPLIINQEYGSSSNTDYKIVGIYYDFLYETTEDIYVDNSYMDYSVIFKNEDSVPNCLSYVFGNYASIFVSLSGNEAMDKELILALSAYDSTEDCLIIKSEISDVLQSYQSMIKVMAKIFLYVGIGFAFFAALLLMNFIAVSISYKKKEIGILRALGARGSDVYGIFFNESLIITFINYLISLVFTIIAVTVFNNIFINEMGINLTLMSFGIRQVVLMFAISLIVALVASFLPTNKISRMKPIDAIQERK